MYTIENEATSLPIIPIILILVPVLYPIELGPTLHHHAPTNPHLITKYKYKHNSTLLQHLMTQGQATIATIPHQCNALTAMDITITIDNSIKPHVHIHRLPSRNKHKPGLKDKDLMVLHELRHRSVHLLSSFAPNKNIMKAAVKVKVKTVTIIIAKVLLVVKITAKAHLVVKAFLVKILQARGFLVKVPVQVMTSIAQYK